MSKGEQGVCVETPCDVAALSDVDLNAVIDRFETQRRRALAAEMDVLAARLGRLGPTAPGAPACAPGWTATTPDPT